MATLRVERDDDVLRVTLARPEKHNAFDAAMIGELTDAFVGVGAVTAVVLTGEGESFCAGADVDWMRASIGLTRAENAADANALRRMFETVDRCPAPLVVGAHGSVLGGGVGLVACADMAIAHVSARFAFSEVKLGIIPAVISPLALRRIGASAARRYFVTGERFGADTALRIELVTEVTDMLETAIDRALDELRSTGPRAMRGTKRLVLSPPGRRTLVRGSAVNWTSSEAQEGLEAFLDEREPAWLDPRPGTGG